MTRVGAVTVGQSPRIDIMPDIAPLLPGVEIVERGALDHYSDPELDAMMSARRDPVLATRRRDGREIIVAEDDVMEGLRRGISELGESGVEAILLLCTGTFPELDSRAPILYPEHLLSGLVGAVCRGCALGVMTPAAAQAPFQQERWERALGKEATISVAHVSPYATEALQGVETGAAYLAQRGVDMVVMDCLGYTREMRALAKRVLERPVVLARTVVARTAAELIGV